MKNQPILFASLITFVLLAPQVQANEPLELQKVMREMGRNMQVITDGIAREDWALVAKTAPLIAEHPKPPISEKVRILKFIGSDVYKFNALDGVTHDAAVDLEHAANEKDGLKVITTFQQLQTACLNCHKTFRGEFVEHFYGAQNR